MSESLYTMQGVTFGYPGSDNCLQNVTLDVERGEFVLITGPSGGGKSTLLRLLVRLEEPVSGTILYKGKALQDYEPPLLRREVAALPQTPSVVSGSVRDNLLLPFGFAVNAALDRPSDARMQECMNELLLDVELAAAAKSLSVGQRQRLCLIRALLLEPSVLLLDEPASALDPTSRDLVETMAQNLCTRDGVSVIMVSHSGFSPHIPHRTIRLDACSLEESS